MIACAVHGFDCRRGSLGLAQDHLIDHGATTDACVSYKSGGGIAGRCPTACDDGAAFPEFARPVASEEVCGNEQAMMIALLDGPLPTAFRAYDDLAFYEGGVYQHVFGDNAAEHAVEIVGYGDEDGVPYWLVKNSWGPDWGEGGYFRVLRGVNECGIEEQCYMIYV